MTIRDYVYISTRRGFMLALFLATLSAKVNGGQLYVSDFRAVGEYDLSTGAAINSQLIGSFNPDITPYNETNLFSPTNMIVIGSDLIVAGSDPYTTGEYNAKTGAVINQNFFGGGGNVFAASGSNLFISGKNYTGVVEFSLVNGALTNYNPIVQGLYYTTGIAVSGTSLFVVNSAGTEEISVYNSQTGAVINQTLVGFLNNPDGIVVAGSDIYLRGYKDLTSTSGYISEYTTSGALVNANLVTGITWNGGMAISGSNLYVANGSNVDLYNTSGSLVESNFVETPPLGQTLELAVSDVPEPESWDAVLGLLLLGAAVMVRDRKSTRKFL